MPREYFHAYHSYLKSLDPLNDAERGRLFTACLEYSKSGAEPELRGNERFVFPMIRSQIDRDAKQYELRCAQNRQNILQRYTNEYDRIRTPTKSTKEKEKEKEKTKEKDVEKENTQRKIPTPDAFEVFGKDDPDLLASLKGFEEMRVKIKKPMTERAKELLISRLLKMTQDKKTMIAIFDQSTAKAWQDIYPLKDEKHDTRKGGKGNELLELIEQGAFDD